MLATAVDTLLRASFMAYSFTIFKLLALVLVPIYFGFMLIGICIRKWKLSINRFELFAALGSFGCSARETEKVNYKFRPISKFVFALIFLPSMVLLTYTTSNEPNIGIGVNANNTCLAYSSSLSRKSIFWETHCNYMCNKTDSYFRCCESAWRFLDDSNPIKIEFPKSNILKFPRVHGVILIVLSSLFLLSILEGLLELCVPFMPYRLLYSYTPIRFQPRR